MAIGDFMHGLSYSLIENISLIKEQFNKDDTLIFRSFNNKYNTEICVGLFYINGMIDNLIVDENIIKKIMLEKMDIDQNTNIVNYLIKNIISTSNVEKTSDLEKVILNIIEGNSILIINGYAEAIIIHAQCVSTRPIEEPDNEKALRGPREGLTESILVNLSLVRRKLKTNDLKFEFRTIGSLTTTKACVSYIEGRVDEGLLEEINRRLDNIDIDGLFDVKTIQELIDDRPYSLFEVSGVSEKPDVIASKLLEGRIAIFLDGTPFVLTVPFLFIEYFQTAEDYYVNYYLASIGRMLRMWAFFFTTSIPALYLSLVAYHKELVPTPLLLSIFASRQGVPLPSSLEILLLLLVFETLRESGSRMPSNIGQALSIVGALVLGTAAVEARIVSMLAIIIIGFSGITALMIPNLSGSFIILRVLFLLLASILGLHGYLMGVMALLIHLCSLKSYNIPFLSTLNTLNTKDLKDTYIRGPRWLIKNRRGHKSK